MVDGMIGIKRVFYCFEPVLDRLKEGRRLFAVQRSEKGSSSDETVYFFLCAHSPQINEFAPFAAERAVGAVSIPNDVFVAGRTFTTGAVMQFSVIVQWIDSIDANGQP